MYDPNSRLLVTNRMNDERLAETRRAHLLRADRDEPDGYVADERLVAGRSLLDRVAAALHHSIRPAATHRPAFR